MDGQLGLCKASLWARPTFNTPPYFTNHYSNPQPTKIHNKWHSKQLPAGQQSPDALQAFVSAAPSKVRKCGQIGPQNGRGTTIIGLKLVFPAHGGPLRQLAADRA